MLDDVYNNKIIEFAANISHVGRLKNPSKSVTKVSRLCGSKVTVDIILSNNIVTEFAHEVKACALGQASSSIMAKNIIGSTVEELILVSEQMNKMLKENGPAPKGKIIKDANKFKKSAVKYKLEEGNTYQISYVNASGWASKREIIVKSVDPKFVKAYDSITHENRTFRKDRIKDSKKI